MAFIEKFLGKRVSVPGDRRYLGKQGLWAKSNQEFIIFGFTEPALVLAGGINDLDWLVPDGQPVSTGDTVIFCITGKIQYIDAPLSGQIHFNHSSKLSVPLIRREPYAEGWVFKIKPDEPDDHELKKFLSADDYIQNLKETDGYKNPDGLIGGVSGICKAVYSGIRGQKIREEK
jgi:glycine cleavage system H protein